MECEAIAAQALKLKVQRTLSNLTYLSDEAHENVLTCKKSPLELAKRLEVISPQVFRKSSAEFYITPFQNKKKPKIFLFL